MKASKIAITAAAILIIAATAPAQNKRQIVSGQMSQYVVSAKAGVVNIVEGEASVTRARPFAIPDMLISGDELQMGDVVKTGARGRAEILLNPGCYLRLGQASNLVFMFDDLSSNKVKLSQGSAVIEASAVDGPLFVETPQTTFEIARNGLYRFNIQADGKAEVLVRKGRALVSDTVIKEGKQAVVSGGTAAIARLNKQDVDGLDDWSKARAKSLVAANTNLSNRGMRRTLGMWSMYNAWIYDPFCQCYTFLPYTVGFASPYGWNYAVYNPFWYRYAWPGYNGGGSGGGNGSGSGRGSGSGNGGGANGGNSGSGGSGGHSSPPPPHSPPPVLSDPGRGAGGGARGADREMPAPIHRHP